MAYRCPYCHETIGEKKLAACPSCGKAMRYAQRRTQTERRERERKLKLMERETLHKRSAFDAEKAESILQSPRKVLWVVFILGVVGWLLFKGSSGTEVVVAESRRHETTLRHLDALATALARYHFHTETWPSTNAGFRALFDDDGAWGWDGPYLDKPLSKIPRDPWKQPYVYTLDENGAPILFSIGSDGIAGTDDDIHASPSAFVLTDMSWTNEWVSAERRVDVVVPPKK